MGLDLLRHHNGPLFYRASSYSTIDLLLDEFGRLGIVIWLSIIEIPTQGSWLRSTKASVCATLSPTWINQASYELQPVEKVHQRYLATFQVLWLSTTSSGKVVASGGAWAWSSIRSMLSSTQGWSCAGTHPWKPDSPEKWVFVIFLLNRNFNVLLIDGTARNFSTPYAVFGINITSDHLHVSLWELLIQDALPTELLMQQSLKSQ